MNAKGILATLAVIGAVALGIGYDRAKSNAVAERKAKARRRYEARAKRRGR